MEDHWRLRDLSATILSDVNRKCMSGGMVTRRHGNQYPKMQRQIFVTLNKVLHNPKTTLPSVYGAVCCEGRRSVGRRRSRAGGDGGGCVAAAGVLRDVGESVATVGDAEECVGARADPAMSPCANGEDGGGR